MPSGIIIIVVLIVVVFLIVVVVHTIQTVGRCKCEASQLQYGERCGKVLPFKHQVTGYDDDDDLVKSLESIHKTFKSGLAGLHGGTR